MDSPYAGLLRKISIEKEIRALNKPTMNKEPIVMYQYEVLGCAFLMNEQEYRSANRFIALCPMKKLGLGKLEGDGERVLHALKSIVCKWIINIK